MAYNPNLYNPYGQPMPTQQQQQPVDGLVWIDGIKGAQMYPLPPNSTSPPLMWKGEPYFTVKTTDAGGAFTLQTFKFQEEILQSTALSDTVTRADLESFKKEIMEAINGKPAVPEPEED